jgi:undecaprenyl-diphosphatase
MRLAEAVGLGLVQGPAELLPVSSSAHVALLLGGRLEGPARKQVEVAVHAGTAAAFALALPRRVPAGVLAASLAPVAAAGYAFERTIETRLGTPATIAAGLLAGSAAMAWADRAPQERALDDAGWVDGLWLGVAQACALVPGVSRSGATLAAARARRFRRADAARLSREVALPVLAAATGLKAWRLARGGAPPGTAPALAAGAASSFAATLASLPLAHALERGRSVAPWVAYRVGLAAVTLAMSR